MTKKERIFNTLNGKITDKIPFSFWTHLADYDLDPEKLAEETYKFYKEYDIDFIKTMNNGMYSVEDFGCIVDFSEIKKGGVAKIIQTPVLSSQDWSKITVKDPNKGTLSRELTSLKLLKERLKMENEEIPIIFTIFSPITTAAKISKEKIFEHISENNLDKNLIHKALKNITETTKLLIKEAKKIGIDGIFLASQSSSYDKTSEKIYQEFGKPYDLEVLKEAEDLWFNVLHIHGNNIMFNILKDYPVNAFNWHIWETLPDIGEFSRTNNKAIVGGLARFDITNKAKNEITNKIYKSLIGTDGKRLIITPGCVIRYPLDKEILNYVREEKERLEKLLFNK